MPPLTAIPSNWTPSDALFQLLAQHNIPREFIQDCVAGFVLYWGERGSLEHAWNSKFAKHVIHEWRKYEIDQALAASKAETQKQVPPVKPMTLDWRPRKLAIDHLLACGIPKLFIEECIVSFAIYWNECGAMSNAWNAKFIDHVKYRDQKVRAIANANGGKRIQSLQEGLVDRDWANSASPFSLPDKR